MRRGGDAWRQPDWRSTPKVEWNDRVRRLTQDEHWIMDGNHAGTRHERMAADDTIAYFDVPTALCMWRVWKRRPSGKRVDHIPGCRDRVDLEFAGWICGYRTCNPPAAVRLLQGLDGTKKVIILRNRRDLEGFFERYDEARGSDRPS